MAEIESGSVHLLTKSWIVRLLLALGLCFAGQKLVMRSETFVEIVNSRLAGEDRWLEDMALIEQTQRNINFVENIVEELLAAHVQSGRMSKKERQRTHTGLNEIFESQRADLAAAGSYWLRRGYDQV